MPDGIAIALQPRNALSGGVRLTVSLSRYLVAALAASGVDRAYCVPGESFLPVLDALYDSAIELVTCCHESSAGFMALADGRLTGVPGVCLVSRGPGATNASIAVHTAQQDGVPMVLFIGQVPRRNLRRGAFQEIDYAAMFGGMAKWVVEIRDPEQLPAALARALHVAISGVPGPVVISLPEDVLEEPIADRDPRPAERVRTAPDAAAIEQVKEWLQAAERPLIVAGGELGGGGGRDALREMAAAHGVPVIVSFRRQDLFDNDHPLFAGELGIFNTKPQIEALRSADLIIAAGTRLNDLTTHGFTFPGSPYAPQRFVHVYDDPAVIGLHVKPDMGVACSSEAFLSALARYRTNAPARRVAWAERLRAFQVANAAWTKRTAPDGVVFGNVTTALSRRVKDDAIIVLDAGTSAALTYRYFPFRPPMRLLATIGGPMGFGVPASVSTAMRYPGRQIVCIAGDGGFLMTGNELLAAVQRKLPICVIVANNGSLGSIRVHQERMFPGRVIGTGLNSPDFAALAAAFGCKSLVISREDDIEPILDAALAHPGPMLVEVKASLSAVLPVATPSGKSESIHASAR
ncbi:MAG: pyruvate decarboxylase [Alphaproteobacteria bacterium]|nr:pyruvate decarboxylase [Alphaproteobacteria bacterium]